MKISVIVPVYNVEKYLPRCLDSIIKQSYADLEIILVDDGSSDNSGIICDEYAQIDARSRLSSKEEWWAKFCEKCWFGRLAHLGGDFVAFVDSDDWLEPDMYEILQR